MYESIWGLRNRPFSPTPEVARYFPADAIEEARQTLVRGIERAEGPGLLIGPSGSGKTLLCEVLALHFRSRFAIALLSSTRIKTTRDLLRAILFELGLPYRRRDEGELRLALIGFLSRSEKCPHGMLLIVDEAHSLNLRVLEELRMLSNLVRGGEPRVRLVLSGGPALEERFTHPKLDSFNQRLAGRCYLRAWDRSETSQFIHSQLASAGGDCEEIFSPEAIDQIHNATEGIPRLVVQLSDHTMTLAAAGGQSRIDAAGIQEAWADLQQLPAPWNESSSLTSAGTESEGGVIEFGELDDDGPSSAIESPAPSNLSAWDDAEEDPLSETPSSETIDETLDRVTATFGELDEACQSEASDAEDVEPYVDQSTATIEIKLATETREIGAMDDNFDDEEIIVDHYGNLDSLIGRAIVAPLDPEARELSAYFADEESIQKTLSRGSAQVAPPETPLPSKGASSSAIEFVDSDPLPEARQGKAEAIADPSADPVMPELQSLATITLQREENPAKSMGWNEESDASEMCSMHCMSSEELPLIVIEDGVPPATNCSGSNEQIAQRQDYGQLFARLQDA